MIIIEAPSTSAALSPMDDGGLVMVVAPHSTPLGLLRRMLARAVERSRAWLAAL
jgi:predicted regulator of Ras-like GTPase activity (Roadblock/LC7/MglB family)